MYSSAIGNGGKTKYVFVGLQKNVAPVLELAAASAAPGGMALAANTFPKRSSTLSWVAPCGRYSDTALPSVEASSSRKPSIFDLPRRNLFDVSIIPTA
jgi:hypothetical protein